MLVNSLSVGKERVTAHLSKEKLTFYCLRLFDTLLTFALCKEGKIPPLIS